MYTKKINNINNNTIHWTKQNKQGKNNNKKNISLGPPLSALLLRQWTADNLSLKQEALQYL